MRALILVLATGAGAGYVPVAPGTAGSVLGLLLVWIFFAPLWERSPALCILTFAAVFAASVWIAGRAESMLAEHDSSKIVIDEILAMAAAMFGVPLTLPLVIAGFLAFRVFDVLKPFPAGWIDRRMRGGAAVMFDDLVAAVYANLVLRAMWYFI